MKKYRVLFVDDVRDLQISVGDDVDLVYARTYQEACDRLAEGNWNLVCLDHDLGDSAGDGTKLAVQMAWESWWPKRDGSIYIHSSNYHGARRMEDTLTMALQNNGDNILVERINYLDLREYLKGDLAP